MISHYHRAMIANLPMNNLLRERQTSRRIAGEAELFDAQKHILERVPPRDSVKPAAHREIGDRNFLIAERLNGLGRNLDVTKQRDVREVPNSHFFNDLVLVLDP